jgi:predicted Zn-dependent peptidase
VWTSATTIITTTWPVLIATTPWPPAVLQVAADELVVPNAFGALLQSAGGVGLNAATSQDSTRYFVSLPSNKLELWFALESQRFQVPVFRWVAKVSVRHA